MYNRYIQSDRGNYIPFSDEQSFSPQHTPPYSDHTSQNNATTDQTHRRNKISFEKLKEVWEPLFNRLHLDSGDLLLLAMLYFLYREDADEELLIALGLLLFL